MVGRSGGQDTGPVELWAVGWGCHSRLDADGLYGESGRAVECLAGDWAGRRLIYRCGEAADLHAEVTAEQRAKLVDLHAHFLAGEGSWYTRSIEPSARGAQEVAAAFLSAWERLRSARHERVENDD